MTHGPDFEIPNFEGDLNPVDHFESQDSRNKILSSNAMRFMRKAAALACIALSGNVATSAANDNYVESSNYAGYKVAPTPPNTLTAVNFMQGDFIVPSITCPPSGDTHSAAWVGLGQGTETDPLYQAGVEMDCSAGVASYSDWWEEYPLNSEQSFQYTRTISAGDKIIVTILPNQSGMSLQVQDYGPTLSQPYPNWTDTKQISETTPTAFASGECIVERPLLDGSYTDLTDFDIVQFSTDTSGSAAKACDLVQNGSDHIISSSGLSWADLYREEMFNGTTKLASTSAQSSTGAFDVNWIASN